METKSRFQTGSIPERSRGFLGYQGSPGFDELVLPYDNEEPRCSAVAPTQAGRDIGWLLVERGVQPQTRLLTDERQTMPFDVFLDRGKGRTGS